MEEAEDYYVYVYIDPRNNEDFYYGKGKGSRKTAHLLEEGESEKLKRIAAIRNENLSPIIKVIAKSLTEKEAHLVEATLIWKQGKTLTNKVAGHFAEKFRPQDTFSINLHGFDYRNGIYYVNIGEGPHRCWEDCRNFGFLSAGQDKKYSDPIRTLVKGDIVVAYLKGKGFVGIGKVIDDPVKVTDFRYQDKSLRECELSLPNIFENSHNEKSEYLVKVDWIVAVESMNAKWTRKGGLFTSQLIKASLQVQQQTLEYLEKEFKVSFPELLNNQDNIDLMKESTFPKPQSLIVYKINPNEEELACEVTLDRNVDGRIFSGCSFYIADHSIIIENEHKEVEGIFSLHHFYLLKQ